MQYFLLIILFPIYGYAFELWPHRLPDTINPNYKYTSGCKMLSLKEITKIFNVNILKKYSGFEIDAYYRSDLNQVLVYHGQKGTNPSESYQCFSGGHILLEDFLTLIREKYPNKTIWLDLKNGNNLDLFYAINKIKKFSMKGNIILETKNILGVWYSEIMGIKASLWLRKKLSGSYKDKLYLWMAKKLSPFRYSQHCKYFLINKIFANNNKNCWNTPKSRQVEISKLKEIKNLKAVLIDI